MMLRQILLLLSLCLSSCGGGDGNAPIMSEPPAPAPQACSLEDQQTWLRSHVRQDYLWNTEAPDVSPSGFVDLRGYFNALLFQGNAQIPRDRYSGFGPSPEFDLYYEQGKTLGYGLAVAGQEVLGQPGQPLWIRYVEPGSPADLAGLRRGDRIVSLNGVATFDLISNEDFSALVPKQTGDTLRVAFERNGLTNQLMLTAAVYTLQPVQNLSVMNTQKGGRFGYVYLHAFLSQAEPGLDQAFSELIAQGVTELVIDLRYNTGGLVSVGERLGSMVGGSRADGQTYTDLIYNFNSRYKNTRYLFKNRLNGEGFKRVYVLAGLRTCSASEQLISGLRGAGIEVIQVGGTTCGKPVGFNARAHCGNTFSIVTFESQNARGEGRYFDGLGPTCSAEDDWSRPLGSSEEGLLKAAVNHMDTGVCPARAAQRRLEGPRASGWPWVEPMPAPAMIQ